VTAGSTLKLQARADADSSFAGWSGACEGSGSSCELRPNQSGSVTARFGLSPATGSEVDRLIAAMPANSWKAITGTPMKDVCPLPYTSTQCEPVVSAWSGGSFDERRDRMLVYGGGHSDSFYNSMFAFDLDSLRWQRLTEMPAGATGDTPGSGWQDRRLETCGYYPKTGPVNLPDSVMMDGKPYVQWEQCFVEPVLSLLDLQQPRSDHTYGKVFVDRLNDRYCYLGGSAYPGGQADSYGVDCLNPVTRKWQRLTRRPLSVGGRGQTALDAQGQLWYMNDMNGPIAKLDLRSLQWTTLGFINYEAGGGTDIDRRRNQLYALVLQADGSHVLRRFELGDSTRLQAQPAYTQLSPAGTAPTQIGSRPGFVYADGLDRFYAWGGGRTVSMFDPAAQRWTRIEAGGDDPGAQQTWGTYGRFRWSPRRGVFVLVNSTTQDVFLFKPGP